MKIRFAVSTSLLFALSAACDSEEATAPIDGSDEITYRSQARLVTNIEDAVPGVFIPPFLDCRDPIAPDSTDKADGQVCTQVAISGATEPGKAFADYASCEIVRAQRPYYPVPAANESDPEDPRVDDAAWMEELAWARDEIRATGCACCHDGVSTPSGPSQWDIGAEPIWLDTISDSGLALFAGFADSSVFGAFPADQNHGFDRSRTGILTTDTERMMRLVLGELERRGISEEAARTTPPFGGPIYANSIKKPEPCKSGEGISTDGDVLFINGLARYVYLMEAGSKNPGVPPNLDRPQGTIWRLDVLPSAEALEPGFKYGTTPAGTYQDTPSDRPAPKLVEGQTYQLITLFDVGLSSTNCTFTYGKAVAASAPQDPQPPAPPATAGFGDLCAADGDCGGDTSYCALLPGATEGYCTITGCKDDASICPEQWGCFDVSVFVPNGPSFCSEP